MVAVTFGVARVPTVEAAQKTGRAETAVPRKSWYARFLDAMIESRMEQARREIRMHTRLMPYTLDDHGNRMVKSETGNVPFGGW